MKRVVLVVLLSTVAPPLAAVQPSAGSILYMTSQEWQRATPAEKTALAADFMRIFCVKAAMPPVLLADCLDRTPAGTTLFESGLACVRQLAETP